MPDNQTSVHSIESTDPEENSNAFPLIPVDGDGPTAVFRHQGWHVRRREVYDALCDIGASHSRLTHFGGCGCQAWILRSTTETFTYRLVPDFCHDRWCVPCQGSRAARIAVNVAEHIDGRPCRFLTLTLKATDDPLKDRLDFLLRAFRRLRRTSLWKERVTGGAAFLEITRGAAGDHWHPHLHVIIEGRYIHKPTLAKVWLDLTGDSYVIDITFVRDPRVVAKYIAKHISKPLDSRLHKYPEALREAMAAMRGRKLIHAFGTWHKWRLLAVPTEEGWALFAHISELLYRERMGDDEAHQILLAILHIPDVPTGNVFCTAEPDERSPPDRDFPPGAQDLLTPEQFLLLP